MTDISQTYAWTAMVAAFVLGVVGLLVVIVRGGA